MARPRTKVPEKRSAHKRIPWQTIQGLLNRGFEPRDIALRLGCSTQNIYERIARQAAKKGGAA